MKKDKRSFEAECGSCGATGIYRGFAEPKGVGVVCLKCRGTGKVVQTYTPFTERKERKDVETVRRSAGLIVALAVGPTGGCVTDRELLSATMPS